MANGRKKGGSRKKKNNKKSSASSSSNCGRSACPSSSGQNARSRSASPESEPSRSPSPPTHIQIDPDQGILPIPLHIWTAKHFLKDKSKPGCNCYRGFPLDALPDRALALAFGQFELQHQIRCFRLVNRHFCSVVEAKCQKRTSLKLLGESMKDVKDLFLGGVCAAKLQDDRDLWIKPEGRDDDLLFGVFHADFVDFMVRLFPNVSKLVVVLPRSWSTTRLAPFVLVAQLLGQLGGNIRKLSLFGRPDGQPNSFAAKLIAVLVDSMPRLTHLDLSGIQVFESRENRAQMSLVLPRLVRLTISCGTRLPEVCLLRHLSARCKRLSVDSVYYKWSERNLRKVFDPLKSTNSLIALSIPVEVGSSVAFICTNFPLLVRLDMKFCGFDSVALNRDFMLNINLLSHLRELRLTDLFIDTKRATISRIAPNLTVRRLILDNFENADAFDGADFWRLITRAFGGMKICFVRAGLLTWIETNRTYNPALAEEGIRVIQTVNGKEAPGDVDLAYRLIKPPIGRHEQRMMKYISEEEDDQEDPFGFF